MIGGEGTGISWAKAPELSAASSRMETLNTVAGLSCMTADELFRRWPAL
jgi:hypothetical protein